MSFNLILSLSLLAMGASPALAETAAQPSDLQWGYGPNVCGGTWVYMLWNKCRDEAHGGFTYNYRVDPRCGVDRSARDVTRSCNVSESHTEDRSFGFAESRSMESSCRSAFEGQGLQGQILGYHQYDVEGRLDHFYRVADACTVRVTITTQTYRQDPSCGTDHYPEAYAGCRSREFGYEIEPTLARSQSCGGNLNVYYSQTGLSQYQFDQLFSKSEVSNLECSTCDHLPANTRLEVEAKAACLIRESKNSNSPQSNTPVISAYVQLLLETKRDFLSDSLATDLENVIKK